MSGSDRISSVIEELNHWAHRRLPQFARRRMDTEDLVQESLYRAMRSIGALEGIDSNALKRYLMVSVDNLIRDEVRRASSGEVVNGTADVPEPETPLDGALEADERRRFRKAILTLSKEDQLLLVGRLDLGLSYEKLAEITHKPTVAAVRVTSRRAALRLARVY